jgi:predicted dehydrogenase
MTEHFDAVTHAEVLSTHPGFDWQAVVDPSTKARQRAKDHWGVPHVFASIDAALAVLQPEVAVLACPSDVRLEAFQALGMVRGVIAEKPLAGAISDAEQLSDLADQRGQLVQVNYWRRADENLAPYLDGGLTSSIGTVQAAFALYGNGLHNNASHLIDLVQAMIGKIKTVTALSQFKPAGPGNKDINLSFAVSMVNGATVHFSPLNFEHYREVSLDLWGTEGRLALYNEGLTMMRFPISQNRGLRGAREVASDYPEPVARKRSSAFRAMYDNFYAALNGNAALISPLHQAMATEWVIEAIELSSRRNGAPVSPNIGAS